MTIAAADLEVLLCDADGNLFPSEGPAFVASAEVTNRLLAALGVERSYTATELRREAIGRNFRATALHLAERHGLELDDGELERYVEDEKQAVTAHLGRTLAGDPEVSAPLGKLAERFRLAAVSSSALARLAACFTATGLDELIPADRRFSAEDSLAFPVSKPDPAVYAFAGEALGVTGVGALAVEDAVAGVESAVAAGFPAVGNLIFVDPEERPQRAAALRDAGAVAVVESWWELEGLLS